MAMIETWLKCDLKKAVQVQQLPGVVFSADNQANLIGVEIMDGGNPATVTGSVYGYAIREDGYTVTITGTLSGNKASIILPASCYAVVGRLSVVIKVGNTTVGAVVSNVYRTTTDAVVDPGHIIPSISELLAQIATMQQLNQTVTAAEQGRVSAESGRVTAESGRVTAENGRVSAESSRVSAELTRVSEFNTEKAAAQAATTAANTAAGKIENMTVAATGSAAGTSPSVTVSDVSGHKHIAFVIPKGDKGDTGKSWQVKRTFLSIAAMQAYDPTQDPDPIELYDAVIIDTGSVEDQDTGKMYQYRPDDQTTTWHYMGDFSGIKGETGNGIASVTLNNDYTLTIAYTDGNSITTASIRGATGATPDISIGTITTVNAGTPASASMTGTPEQPVLNMSIPKGYDATIKTQTAYYQSSSSGTTIPIGTWSTTIPTVAQGDFLWVKYHIVWYDDVESDIYGVSRQGMDGLGTVSEIILGALTLMPNSSGVLTIPVDALPTENSNAMITSGRIYTEIDSLNDRIDQLDPEAPSAIFSDVNFSIAVADWTLDSQTGFYNAVVTNTTLLTANAGVQVFYDSSFRTALVGDIYVNKSTGYVTFTTLSAPQGTLTGFMRIMDSTSGLVPVHRGGTGAATPKQARENLNTPIRDIPVNFGTVSSLPQTVYDADLRANMIGHCFEFSNPGAIKGGLELTFADPSGNLGGAVTISLASGGTFSGETTIKFLAHEKRTAVEGSETVSETQRVADFVQTNAQTLTAAQKTQARTNVGAASSSEVGTVPSGKTVQGQIDELNDNITWKHLGDVSSTNKLAINNVDWKELYCVLNRQNDNNDSWQASFTIIREFYNSYPTRRYERGGSEGTYYGISTDQTYIWIRKVMADASVDVTANSVLHVYYR